MRLFNVTDTEENKLIMQGATIPMLARMWGLEPGYLTSAVGLGEKVKGKYLIEPIGLRETPSNSMPVTLWHEWDKIYEIAGMIRNGKARIVSERVKGGWRRHTEVIG
ncbi:hypothetical protein [Anaerocolumna chitinilytica]|uniref:Uncharacterized protein n=1 Tax=Anaerocolumna chitinilytica TaxID=1727145 RepID=A0A7M3SAL0_9FIRM|nr:hypothetical protein [Anaerocolumna chitinilytica]BCK01628.1 hypothetical protein bsdcttw_46680 [Anaerocolumna chitinilytica]